MNITECKKPTSKQDQKLPPYNKTYIGRAEKWLSLWWRHILSKNKQETKIVANCLNCWSPVHYRIFRLSIYNTVPYSNDILLYIQWNHKFIHTITLLIFRKIFSLSLCMPKENTIYRMDGRRFPAITSMNDMWNFLNPVLDMSVQINPLRGCNVKSSFLRHVLGVVKSFYPLARKRCLHTKTKVHLVYPSSC